MARSWLGVGLEPAGTWGNVAVMGWLGWQRLGCARRCCLAAVELCWCFLVSVGRECLLAPAREAFMVACLRIATQLDACVFPVVILARLVVKLSSSVSDTGCLAAAACVFWRAPGCHATAGWCACRRSSASVGWLVFVWLDCVHCSCLALVAGFDGCACARLSCACAVVFHSCMVPLSETRSQLVCCAVVSRR
jgi:hypothetical protein